jgi:hypothetical protein
VYESLGELQINYCVISKKLREGGRSLYFYFGRDEIIMGGNGKLGKEKKEKSPEIR